ncbi:kallikrein-5 [Suncus etruscus]|uniref:kallikrein-5 n=1 Tax=Suncus etruscus TaxID=109475 RepID=UPI0021106417|nr:kallikrein-5 [Suncus etruscus]
MVQGEEREGKAEGDVSVCGGPGQVRSTRVQEHPGAAQRGGKVGDGAGNVAEAAHLCPTSPPLHPSASGPAQLPTHMKLAATALRKGRGDASQAGPLPPADTDTMTAATQPRTWVWGILTTTSLILGLSQPLLANVLPPCNPPPVHRPSGSTRDLSTGTRENDNNSNRIVNGTDCEKNTHPWQAALLLDANRLYCGGVLVDPQWLLTAAHCHKKNVKIRLGHYSLSSAYESGQQMFKGVKSIPHPGYAHPGHSNDLMLIKLNRRAIDSESVRVIHIPSSCPKAGTQCEVSGWGTTSSPEVNFPKVLQCLNIKVLSQEKCQDAYPRQIDDSMFCAGDEAGRDSCQGDSGGPVVCNGTLQGLVSWGDFPCAQPNRPGVYTKLCRFTKWIRNTISSN